MLNDSKTPFFSHKNQYMVEKRQISEPNPKKDSEALFRRQVRFAVVWAILVSLLSAYNLFGTVLWTIQMRREYDSMMVVVDAANEGIRQFHVSSSDCEIQKYNATINSTLINDNIFT